MKRIRIAFVASTFGIGGAERVISEVVVRLRADRFEPQLYFMREAGPLGRELFARGVGGVERIETRRGDPLAVARLWRYFRRERPDVAFCMDHHNAMLVGRVAGVAARVHALVVGSHSSEKAVTSYGSGGEGVPSVVSSVRPLRSACQCPAMRASSCLCARPS